MVDRTSPQVWHQRNSNSPDNVESHSAESGKDNIHDDDDERKVLKFNININQQRDNPIKVIFRDESGKNLNLVKPTQHDGRSHI